MKIRQLTLSKAYKRLCNEFLDKLKLFRHYPTDLFALACIVIYKQLHPSWKTDSDWSERFCYITINYSNKFTIIVKHTHAICIGKTMFSARTKILFFCRFALENFSSFPPELKQVVLEIFWGYKSAIYRTKVTFPVYYKSPQFTSFRSLNERIILQNQWFYRCKI